MHGEPSFHYEFQQLGHELGNFLETRYEMLRAELKTGVARMRSAAVLFAAAALLGATGLILLGFCASFAIALAFGAFQNQVGVAFGFLITGSCALLVAGVFGLAAKAALNPEELTPKHTLRVLKRDGESFRQAM